MKEPRHIWPRPVLFTIGLLLVGFGVGLYFVINNQTILKTISNETATFSRVGVITSLDKFISESQSENLVGSSVLLREVMVKEVLGNYLFMIGNDNVSIPVVLLGELTSRQREEVTEVYQGQLIRINGFLYSLQDISTIIDNEYISHNEMQQLKQSAVFIMATRALVTSRQAEETSE